VKPRLITGMARGLDGRLYVSLVCGHWFTAPVLLEPAYQLAAQGHNAKAICEKCAGRAPDEVTPREEP
jgi:hypothetical protein